ncbi:MAG: DNRLRE domain-containing protein [Bacteroidales bacterium]|jgi:hypothetical protein|nr:DNRLRE domain-containing protein [Bacteroidales bacterium]MDY0201929.1 DNRLRE domain-containing protein [Tenuifilaceae bacterium]
MKKFYITITALLVGFALLNAQTTTVYPSDDMTTNTGSSTMFPNDGELWVANLAAMQNFHQTLLKFDLSAYSGQTINSASLNLYQFFHAPDGTPTPSKIYAITESWDEQSWPTINNVSHSSAEYASPNFTSTLGWYSIDITALVQEWTSGNMENNGLVIIGDVGTKFAELYSKEAADASKHPFLEIEGSTSIADISTYINQLSVFPNPMEQKASLDFDLLSAQEVNIYIVNSQGIQMQQICKKHFTAGKHHHSFDCNNLKPGFYFIRLETMGAVMTKKIIIK